jgi:hypothetical protein
MYQRPYTKGALFLSLFRGIFEYSWDVKSDNFLLQKNLEQFRDFFAASLQSGLNGIIKFSGQGVSDDF